MILDCQCLIVHVCLCVQHTTYFCAGSASVNNVEQELARCGLEMKPVIGDGNCFFRSLAKLDGSRHHVGWREHLADVMQAKVDQGQDGQAFVDRANDSFKHFKNFKKYDNFSSLIKDMRRNQWGYSDWIEAFCSDQNAQILCLDGNGIWNLYRPKVLTRVKHQYFMFCAHTEEGNMGNREKYICA